MTYHAPTGTPVELAQKDCAAYLRTGRYLHASTYACDALTLSSNYHFASGAYGRVLIVDAALNSSAASLGA